jgi:MFS family permease
MGLLIAATINETTTYSVIVIVMILLGLSLGLFSTPNMAAIMASVEPEHFGTASSLVSTMRSTGMLFSATAIALILSIYLGDQSVSGETLGAFMESMQTSLLLFSILSIVGTFFSMVKGRLAVSLSEKSSSQ